MNLEDYVAITESLSPEQARLEFDAALRTLDLDRTTLEDTDFLLEVIRGANGKLLHRYLLLARLHQAAPKDDVSTT